MLKFSALIILTSLLTCPLMVKAQAGGKNDSKYIGLQYPPVPDGITIEGGWVIEQKGSNALSDYSIGSVVEGDKTSLWLERLIGQDPQGKPSFQVVDVLPLPPIDNQKEDILGGSPYQCRINEGEYDPTLIVIAQLEDGNTEFLTQVRQAWRVDLASEQFNEINLQGLEFKCENMGFGL